MVKGYTPCDPANRPITNAGHIFPQDCTCARIRPTAGSGRHLISKPLAIEPQPLTDLCRAAGRLSPTSVLNKKTLPSRSLLHLSLPRLELFRLCQSRIDPVPTPNII